MARLFTIVYALAVLGCGADRSIPHNSPPGALQRLVAVDGTRWIWTHAGCSDRPLRLADRGFEQQLRVARTAGSELLFVYDNEFAADGCAQTVVWSVSSGSPGNPWRFEEQTRISLPPDRRCQGRPEASSEGVIRFVGDLLEVTTYGSDWCNGFDARFVYRRAEPADLSDSELIRHWAAAFNRRDADAVASLFAVNGSLVEPLSFTDDGNPRRHLGREQIRQWYAACFASVGWMAMRLLSIEPSGGTGHYVVEWQYMDQQLVRPREGRNLFLIADGEIYETELQMW